MPRHADPWELAQRLRAAVEAVERSWKVDKSAPGTYVRIPVAVQKQCSRALLEAPSYLNRVRKVDGRDVITLADEDTAALRAAVDAVIERSVPLSADAVVVRRKDFEELARARSRSNLLDDIEQA